MIRKLLDKGAPGGLTWAAFGRLALGILVMGVIVGVLREYFDSWAEHARPDAGSCATRVTGATLGLALAILACSLAAKRFDFLALMWGVIAGQMAVSRRSPILRSAVVAMLFGALAGWMARLYCRACGEPSD
jgi:hypothetical protein